MSKRVLPLPIVFLGLFWGVRQDSNLQCFFVCRLPRERRYGSRPSYRGGIPAVRCFGATRPRVCNLLRCFARPFASNLFIFPYGYHPAATHSLPLLLFLHAQPLDRHTHLSGNLVHRHLDDLLLRSRVDNEAVTILV